MGHYAILALAAQAVSPLKNGVSLIPSLRQRYLRSCPCLLCCSTAGSIRSGGVCSSDNPQSNIWDQVEQKNAKLVQRYPNVVQGIKLLD